MEQPGRGRQVSAANPAAWAATRYVNRGSDRPSSSPAAFGAVSP